MKAEGRRKNVEQPGSEEAKLFDAFVAWLLCCSKKYPFYSKKLFFWRQVCRNLKLA
jgi:hypothetical protein